MSSSRRNTVTREDEIKVLVVSAVSGVLAAMSGASPTGSTTTDAIVCFAYAAFVGWLGATASWWALAAGAGLVLVGSSSGPLALSAVALVAVAAALWIGSTKTSLAPLRSLIALAVVQVSLRLEYDPVFLASAAIAAVAVLLIAVTGFQRRHRYVRKRVLWGLAGTAVAALIALGGLGVGAAQARSAATSGYQEMLNGLEYLQDGDLAEASVALRSAAADLEAASTDLDSVFTQPSKLIPVVAQNRNSSADIVARAADAATSAADTLDVVNLDSLTITNGVIDVAALEILEPPLTELEATVTELIAALEDADSPWLLPPLQSRLDTALRRADQVEQQAKGTAATARLAPTMLGIDGERRYLFLFTNSAESRGTNGVMGNWSEVTIDEGRLSVTGNGRANDLIAPLREGDVQLAMPQEFFDRYGAFGAGSADGGTSPKFWSNSTVAPDMPTVGNVTAQLYEQATGRTVDGVFVVDPAGVAALLDVTGPITVPGLDFALTGDNAEQFLTLDQYEFVENEREDLLSAVTEQTIETVLTSSLPAPQDLVGALGPAAIGGHISGWAVRPEDQELFRIVGMENALPTLTGENLARDGLAVVVNNANGNKIDSFLKRQITYTAQHDPTNNDITATLEITLTNDSPTSGYPDYVIGNLIDRPKGTNRMYVDVYTPLGLSGATAGAESLGMAAGTEIGWNVYRGQVEIPPGESLTITLELYGWVGGPYELVYRPQALPNPDQLVVAVDSGGDDIDYSGEPERRIVISADGVQAWR